MKGERKSIRRNTMLKFREITECKGQNETLMHKYNTKNELECRYELLRTGTPNNFDTSWCNLKATIIRNDVSAIELTEIENVLKEIYKQQSDSVNKRNYFDFPRLLKTSYRFKDTMSDHREVSDFVEWFDTQYKMVYNSDKSALKKFQDKQTLIASGFNELLVQLGKQSKSRTQLIRTLWNKNSADIMQIIDELTATHLRSEKTYLSTINKLHTDYQSQIDQMIKEHYKTQEDLVIESKRCKEQVIYHRLMRRRIAKASATIAQLTESYRKIKIYSLYQNKQNIVLQLASKDFNKEDTQEFFKQKYYLIKEIYRIRHLTKNAFFLYYYTKMYSYVYYYYNLSNNSYTIQC